MIPGDAHEPPPVDQPLVTIADLEASDFEAPVRDLDVCDPMEIAWAYERAYAADQGNHTKLATYRLLYTICSLRLAASDPGPAWGPFITMDVPAEQTTILASLVGRLSHPGLRARIADFSWSNNRRDGASAEAAIRAYCESVEGLLNGRFTTRHGRPTTSEAIPFIHRALQMARLTKRRAKWPEQLTDAFTSLYEATRTVELVGMFVSLARLALEFHLRTPLEIATQAEALATASTTTTYPIAIKAAFDLAAQLYQNLGNQAARRRCLIGAVEQLAAMRSQVAGQAAAEAGWVMEALLALRHIEGMEEREYELEIELRRLQKASLKQMGRIDTDLALGATPLKVAEYFRSLSLSEALKQFALLDQPRDPARLKASVLEIVETSPLMAMMSVSHVDNEGRTATKSEGAPMNGEPDDSWFLRMIGQLDTIHRARTVAGRLEPARLAIQSNFTIEERHFHAIVLHSAFIPQDQKRVLALGFARFFQGDFISAAYLLVPQVEPCLRHLLKMRGQNPVRRRDDGTEEDLSLGALFDHHRPQLDEILTPARAGEIDRMFNAHPGPGLRHELAHGQVSAEDCASYTVHYAIWMIYQLCSILLINSWDQVVAPELASWGDTIAPFAEPD